MNYRIFLKMISDNPQRHWAAYQSWCRYHPEEDDMTKPFIAWADKDSKINTEHGLVTYEEFCKNEVSRMKGKKKIKYKGKKVCVA